MLTSPLMWVTTITSFFLHLSGGHLITFFRGAPSEAVIIKTLKKHEVAFWSAGPAILMSLLNWPARPCCASLRTIVVSGMPISADHMIEIRDKLFDGKVNVCQVYGLTETGVLTSNFPHANKIGSVGKVFYNTKMKVLEKGTDIALGPCEEGELCFKSNSLMLEYCNNPQATEEVFDEEQFFHTGDQGYYDGQGFIYITGRIKELIKWKSYQIAPVEVENKLIMYPAFKEVTVFGVFDENENELVTAAVVLNKGFENTNLNLLQSLVNEQLSYNKKIRGGIHAMKEFPYTSSGKLIKRQIVKEITDRVKKLVPEEFEP